MSQIPPDQFTHFDNVDHFVNPERFSYSLDQLQTSEHLSLPETISHEQQIMYYRLIEYLRPKIGGDMKRSKQYHRMFRCFNDFRCYIHNSTHEPMIKPHRCYMRICPICQRSRVIRVRHKIKQLMARCKNPRMWTFTLKNSDDSLEVLFERIIKAFSAFRRTKLFKTHIRGGFWVFEATFNNDTQQWNPHLHAILDSKYMSHKKAVKAWNRITEDSYVIWFSPPEKKSEMVKYLSKYVSKGISPGELPDHRLDEWIYNMEGKRLWNSFGKCYGKMTAWTDPSVDPEEWSYIGKWKFRDEFVFPGIPRKSLIHAFNCYVLSTINRFTLSERDRERIAFRLHSEFMSRMNDPPMPF